MEDAFFGDQGGYVRANGDYSLSGSENLQIVDMGDLLDLPAPPPLKRVCRTAATWVSTMAGGSRIDLLQQQQNLAYSGNQHGGNASGMHNSKLTGSSVPSSRAQQQSQQSLGGRQAQLNEFADPTFVISDYWKNLIGGGGSEALPPPVDNHSNNGFQSSQQQQQQQQQMRFDAPPNNWCQSRAFNTATNEIQTVGNPLADRSHSLQLEPCNCSDCMLLQEFRNEWSLPAMAADLTSLGALPLMESPSPNFSDSKWLPQGRNQPLAQDHTGMANMTQMPPTRAPFGQQNVSPGFLGSQGLQHNRGSQSLGHQSGNSGALGHQQASLGVLGQEQAVLGSNKAPSCESTSSKTESRPASQSSSFATTKNEPQYLHMDNAGGIQQLSPADLQVEVAESEVLHVGMLGEPEDYKVLHRQQRGQTQRQDWDYGARQQLPLNKVKQEAPCYSELELQEELVAFAEAVAVDDQEKANKLMKVLKQRVDPAGTPLQRVAYYLMIGISVRLQGLSSLRYSVPLLTLPEGIGSLAWNQHFVPPAQEYVETLVEITKHVPYRAFLTKVVNTAFLEASSGASCIHILDLGWWHSSQWPSFMRDLLAWPGPRPFLRITKLDTGDASPAKNAGLGLGNIRMYLTREAAAIGIPFEFCSLETSPEKLQPQMLTQNPGEVLLVNGAMRFHTLSDGSVMRSSPRDLALKAIRKLNPKVFVLGEKHVNHNDRFFLRRFRETLSYFASVFDSVDAGLPRDSDKRALFEKKFLGRDIINIVACEGLQRVCRSEPLQQWQARLKDAGFRPVAMRPGLKGELEQMLRHFPNKYGVREEEKEQLALLLTWKNFPLFAASVWHPAR